MASYLKFLKTSNKDWILGAFGIIFIILLFKIDL